MDHQLADSHHRYRLDGGSPGHWDGADPGRQCVGELDHPTDVQVYFDLRNVARNAVHFYPVYPSVGVPLVILLIRSQMPLA